MTPFLQRYIAHMVSLGINFEQALGRRNRRTASQARGSATRTLRKHVELLGTSYEVHHESDAAKGFGYEKIQSNSKEREIQMNPNASYDPPGAKHIIPLRLSGSANLPTFKLEIMEELLMSCRNSSDARLICSSSRTKPTRSP